MRRYALFAFVLAVGCYGESVHPPQEPALEPGPEGTEIETPIGRAPRTGELDTDRTRPIAKSVAEDFLQRYPDLNGIFGSNDDCALGALQAVRAAGREDIVIVGFDATDEARSEILKGSPLKADAVQFPRKIGAKTMEVVA
ncbi:MAG: substrate-binding domain-containing protein, partial [Planctomycetota bacterium]